MNSFLPLEPLLSDFAARAAYLVPILTLALFVGEPLARLLRFPALRHSLSALLIRLDSKLNRPQRSTATRLYRGIVVLVLLLVPTLALGLLLMRPVLWVELLATLLLVALFGELLRPYQLLRLRRAARAGTLTLQSDDPPYLFADTHAQLRYRIVEAADRVALLVGASLYFLAAGPPGALLYLALAAAARHFAASLPENRAFGWAAQALFGLLDALPRFLSCLLLWLAACCTPGTAPWGTLRRLGRSARAFHGWLAYLLDLALGGPTTSPAGPVSLPWLGTGTPRPEAVHYSRALQLSAIAIAAAIWILVLSSSIYLLPTH